MVLTRVLQDAGAPAVWTEWCADDPACPESHRGLGSPTILVNGEDVAPGPHPWAPRQPGQGPRVRPYREGDATTAVPPAELIAAAVQRALGPEVV